MIGNRSVPSATALHPPLRHRRAPSRPAAQPGSLLRRRRLDLPCLYPTPVQIRHSRRPATVVHAPIPARAPPSSSPLHRLPTLAEVNSSDQGYWAEIVDRLDGAAARYEALERARNAVGRGHRRRHAEREHLRYAAARNAAARGAVPGPDGGGQSRWRRPFVTHFTGCKHCGGRLNQMYSRRRCDEEIHRALAFADDQVLCAYWFRRAAPLSDGVRPLPRATQSLVVRCATG
ncbi:hypothetical protein ACP70R_045845 [Stipagrostis hirtigluma subsp. patula]